MAQAARHRAGHRRASSSSYELDITYPLAWGHEGVEAKLASLCAEAVDAVKAGNNILIVSDRRVGAATTWPSRRCWPRRPSTSTWCAKACARPPAWWWKPAPPAKCTTSPLLAGYGAEAVHPYLAMETLAEHGQGPAGRPAADKAVNNYIKAIGKGLTKVMSKMGMSTYMSYCGAQMFEAIGLNRDAGGQVLHRHRQPTSKASACSRSPRKRCACTSAAFSDDPVLANMLDAGGEYA